MPTFFNFRYSLDEFGTARRTAIVRSFIDALTRGGMFGTLFLSITDTEYVDLLPLQRAYTNLSYLCLMQLS